MSKVSDIAGLIVTSNRGYTSWDLASTFGVSQEYVSKVIARLRDMGNPVVCSEINGLWYYYIARSPGELQAWLDRREKARNTSRSRTQIVVDAASMHFPGSSITFSDAA